MTDQSSGTSNLRLVERLRDNAQGINLGAEGMGWGPADLYAAAADEIERMGAALKSIAEYPGLPAVVTGVARSALPAETGLKP